jgi:hypothetical protein
MKQHRTTHFGDIRRELGAIINSNHNTPKKFSTFTLRNSLKSISGQRFQSCQGKHNNTFSMMNTRGKDSRRSLSPIDKVRKDIIRDQMVAEGCAAWAFGVSFFIGELVLAHLHKWSHPASRFRASHKPFHGSSITTRIIHRRLFYCVCDLVSWHLGKRYQRFLFFLQNSGLETVYSCLSPCRGELISKQRRTSKSSR